MAATDVSWHLELMLLAVDNPKALGCNVPSAARALLYKGLRVSTASSSHWSRCLTNLEHTATKHRIKGQYCIVTIEGQHKI